MRQCEREANQSVRGRSTNHKRLLVGDDVEQPQELAMDPP